MADEVISSSVLDPEKSYDVTVDPLTNDVYVDHGTTIAAYGPAGEGIGGFEIGQAESEGVAVNGISHDIYASDRGGSDIDVFEAAVVPDVTKCEAIAISPTSATLVGKVNPDKTKAEYFFRYGPTTPYEFETPLTLIGEGNEGESYVTVEAPIAGLINGQIYHCQVDAINKAAIIDEGEDEIFSTPFAVILETGTAAHIGGTKATLAGFVDPKGEETSCWFNYGLNAEPWFANV